MNVSGEYDLIYNYFALLCSIKDGLTCQKALSLAGLADQQERKEKGEKKVFEIRQRYQLIPVDKTLQKSKRITPAIESQIIEIHNDGYQAAVIARAYGICPSTAMARIKNSKKGE